MTMGSAADGGCARQRGPCGHRCLCCRHHSPGRRLRSVLYTRYRFDWHLSVPTCTEVLQPNAEAEEEPKAGTKLCTLYLSCLCVPEWAHAVIEVARCSARCTAPPRAENISLQGPDSRGRHLRASGISDTHSWNLSAEGPGSERSDTASHKGGRTDSLHRDL